MSEVEVSRAVWGRVVGVQRAGLSVPDAVGIVGADGVLAIVFSAEDAHLFAAAVERIAAQIKSSIDASVSGEVGGIR